MDIFLIIQLRQKSLEEKPERDTSAIWFLLERTPLLKVKQAKFMEIMSGDNTSYVYILNPGANCCNKS